MHGAISRFARMDPPVIMAVNGMAAGAGMSLAVSGDFVLMAESAYATRRRKISNETHASA